MIKQIIIMFLILTILSLFLYANTNSNNINDKKNINNDEVKMTEFQFYKILFIIVGGLILGCIKFNYAFLFLAIIFLMVEGNYLFTMEDFGVAITILIFIPVLAAQGGRDFLKGK